MNNRTSAQSPGLQKMSSLAKAGEGFGWEMTHSRYREQRALSLCALSDLRFHLSWSDMERCCGWVAGLLINRLSLKLHLQDPPPTIKLSFDLHSNSQKQEALFQNLMCCLRRQCFKVCIQTLTKNRRISICPSRDDGKFIAYWKKYIRNVFILPNICVCYVISGLLENHPVSLTKCKYRVLQE